MIIRSVGHSATTFRNFAIRQKTIRQKRHSETLPFGKTIRQKIFRSLVIGHNSFGNRTIGNLYSAKVNNEINSVRQNTIRQNTLWKQTFGKFRFRNQSFGKKPFSQKLLTIRVMVTSKLGLGLIPIRDRVTSKLGLGLIPIRVTPKLGLVLLTNQGQGDFPLSGGLDEAAFLIAIRTT